ncbi:GatB/YqeY domain-containing protein [Candidatus Collierbacteria bacterium]|nr:GatB/YqeY domain-containing protein [Candidatus Collierbacteria bacterium]
MSQSKLLERIRQDITAAQKGQDRQKLGALRLLVSEINYRQIDAKDELSDDRVIEVLRREAKKREEASEIYAKADDEPRLAQEKYELELIRSYLPAMMNEADIFAVVKKAKEETGKSGGVLIGEVMGRLKGKADGAVVARLVGQIEGNAGN